MKKTLICTILFCNLFPAQAVDSSCDNALHLCQQVIASEDLQVIHLKQQVKDLEKKVVSEEDPLIPWWGWGIIGAVVGGIAVKEISK